MPALSQGAQTSRGRVTADMEERSVEYRKPLQWGEMDPHRRESTRIGMWAWMWQRVSSLAILVLLVLHIIFTYKPVIQFLLLLAVTFHASLGLRVILLDFNLVSVRYQRTLVWCLMALGVGAAMAIWFSIY
jgi:succinate dehydrogenase hydrophobic anchor subunit